MASEPDRSVWHRAAAALGPDPATAADLAEFAQRAITRGAVSVAVDALERAAALTGDAKIGNGLLLQAAKLASEIPHGKDRASTLIDKIVPACCGHPRAGPPGPGGGLGPPQPGY